MKDKEISRRHILKTSLAGLAGVLAISAKSASQALAACSPTPAQMEGPYYPESDLNRDSDLTQIEEGGPKAEGQVIYLTGKVSNSECQPLKALVEIWQAAASGKYNHSEDPNPLKLDPHFQYWGRVQTASDGSFLFKTIIPGHYPIGGGKFRPPHIHFKVHAKHHVSLTTQSYFDPKSYDDLELSRLVDRLNRAEGVDRRLMVLFENAGAGFEEGAKLGRFDITLHKMQNLE